MMKVRSNIKEDNCTFYVRENTSSLHKKNIPVKKNYIKKYNFMYFIQKRLPKQRVASHNIFRSSLKQK